MVTDSQKARSRGQNERRGGLISSVRAYWGQTCRQQFNIRPWTDPAPGYELWASSQSLARASFLKLATVNTRAQETSKFSSGHFSSFHIPWLGFLSPDSVQKKLGFLPAPGELAWLFLCLGVGCCRLSSFSVRPETCQCQNNCMQRCGVESFYGTDQYGHRCISIFAHWKPELRVAAKGAHHCVCETSSGKPSRRNYPHSELYEALG